MKDAIFINYTHPSERSDKQNRKVVATHVAGEYRRSLKRIELRSPGAFRWKDTGVVRSIRDSTETERTAERVLQPTFVPVRATGCLSASIGGFRTEDFDSYPIASSVAVTKAVDHCESRLPQI